MDFKSQSKSPWELALDDYIHRKTLLVREGFFWGMSIKNGRDIVKLLKLQYNKVYTVSMM